MKNSMHKKQHVMPDDPMDDKDDEIKEINELTKLLTRCKIGDKTAFNLLYQKTAPRLNGIAYRITKNVDSANEVLQEAFIQIWKNTNNYQSNQSEPFTWLAAIVRYRAYDRLRYDKRRHQTDMIELNENEIEAMSFNCEQLGFTEYSQKSLDTCLSKLEYKQSQSILMAYLYGYSREDISKYFKSPQNTIKSWIRRGLGRLQLCLSK